VHFAEVSALAMPPACPGHGTAASNKVEAFALTSFALGP
jgi:hypothetical protein